MISSSKTAAVRPPWGLAPSPGLAPGTPVRFRNIPGFRPRVALVLAAGQPVDPGWGGGGSGYASVPARLVWPSPGAVGLVAVRFVNVPVTITNVGRASLQIRLAGSTTDDQGREAGEVNREDSAWPGPYGRGPDWTSRPSPPIRPGARATRYITFPVAQGSRAVVFSLWPMPGFLIRRDLVDVTRECELPCQVNG